MRTALALGVTLLAGCGTTTDATDDTDDTEVDTETEDTEVDTEDTEVERDLCLLEPAAITVGTGEDDFLALSEGQDLEMVYGPQGGWHLTTALRADHVIETVNFAFTVTDVETGTVVSDSNLNAVLPAHPPGLWNCSGEFLNYQAVLQIPEGGVDGATGSPPDVLCGREVDITVTIVVPALLEHPQAGETLGTGTVRVIAQPDPDDDGPPCTGDDEVEVGAEAG